MIVDVEDWLRTQPNVLHERVLVGVITQRHHDDLVIILFVIWLVYFFFLAGTPSVIST